MKATAYAVFAYLAFLATFLYFVGFVEGVLVPRSVDSPASSSLGLALVVDCGWFILFAVQHSVMARPSFKRRWTRVIPVGAERSTYVLASSLMFVLLFVVWRPIPIVVWRVPIGVASYAVTGLSIGGWGLALAATYAIDHYELFGLRRAIDKPELRTPMLYRLVRHPLYLGFIVAFWSAPIMTVGHAVFALGLTIYIAIGLRFEERDLVRTFGESYIRYRQNVPALLPWPRPRPSAQPTTTVDSA